jgi:hypothetical protein
MAPAVNRQRGEQRSRPAGQRAPDPFVCHGDTITDVHVRSSMGQGADTRNILHGSHQLNGDLAMTGRYGPEYTFR